MYMGASSRPLITQGIEHKYTNEMQARISQIDIMKRLGDEFNLT